MTPTEAEPEAPASAAPTTALLLTVREVAAMLSTSTRTVWRWSATGEIPAPLRIGGAVRWHRQHLLDFVARAERQADRERRLPT